ncbi:hypothetical protein [Caulobacter sp.]|uniref:hypothetical protein n=1 Tax=Caulobacter sp. TaxID=78 RepID=UPI003BAB75ED
MVEQVLRTVFENAAAPQRAVLIVLTMSLPAIVAAAVMASRAGGQTGPCGRLICDLRILGPALGLLVGAMNSFHMARTIQSLPFHPTARQLAPGILEVSTLIGLGAGVGLLAAAAHLALGWTPARTDSPSDAR